MNTENKHSEENNLQVVRAILITTDGSIIIGKRARGEYEANKWCLVGGKAEGENLSDELFREIEEEAGIKMESLTDETEPVFVLSRNAKKLGRIWRNNYFILEVDDCAVPNILERFNKREFSEIRTVSAKDLKGLHFAFGDGRVVRDFFRFVGN